MYKHFQWINLYPKLLEYQRGNCLDAEVVDLEDREVVFPKVLVTELREFAAEDEELVVVDEDVVREPPKPPEVVVVRELMLLLLLLPPIPELERNLELRGTLDVRGLEVLELRDVCEVVVL